MAEPTVAGVAVDGHGRQRHLVDVGDARLCVVEVGRDGDYPIVVLHGGPGLDHHEFADYLDPLTERGYRLILVDQRSSGRSPACDPATWTLEVMAADVGRLARSMGLARYAVLGHSYGAFVALQQAVDFPDDAAQSIVSGGVPSARFLADVEANLDAFEPVELREQVKESWERETSIRTREDFASVMHDQLPFHFADPLDPRIGDYERRSAGTIYSPDVLRTFAANDYGAIEVEDRLGEITHPVLVTTGRHDRTCTPEASEAIAAGAPTAELRIFERSGHMTFVEEQEEYLALVDDFLRRHGAA